MLLLNVRNGILSYESKYRVHVPLGAFAEFIDVRYNLAREKRVCSTDACASRRTKY